MTSLRALKSRLSRLEQRAEKANVPTPQEYAEAHRRHMARLHEKWAADLGNPGGSLLSEEDRAILADDTPGQRRKDEEVIEAWRRGADLKAEAEEARARLLAMR
ncbi:MAG: hypothetical protein M3R38_04760 [Actinomycetota bacterium]|nr:hypothetical protein [Actinomycetota bacterium]